VILLIAIGISMLVDTELARDMALQMIGLGQLLASLTLAYAAGIPTAGSSMGFGQGSERPVAR